MQPNSVMSINAVEAYPLEDFSPESVKSLLAEAQKVAAGSGSAIDKAEAEIEIEVSSWLLARGVVKRSFNLTYVVARFWRAFRRA